MIYTIPLYSDSVARWTEKIDLDNKRYLFYFSWNDRCEYWELSICDDNDKLLVGGIKLVTTIDLLDEYRSYAYGLPKGRLQLVKKDNLVLGITRENLNSNFMLMYVSED